MFRSACSTIPGGVLLPELSASLSLKRFTCEIKLEDLQEGQMFDGLQVINPFRTPTELGSYRGGVSHCRAYDHSR